MADEALIRYGEKLLVLMLSLFLSCLGIGAGILIAHALL